MPMAVPRFIAFVAATFAVIAIVVSPLLWLVTPNTFPETTLFYDFLMAGGIVGILVRYLLGVNKLSEIFERKRAKLQDWLNRSKKSDPNFEDYDKMNLSTRACLQTFHEL